MARHKLEPQICRRVSSSNCSWHSLSDSYHHSISRCIEQAMGSLLGHLMSSAHHRKLTLEGGNFWTMPFVSSRVDASTTALSASTPLLDFYPFASAWNRCNKTKIDAITSYCNSIRLVGWRSKLSSSNRVYNIF
jgi:hypothetical protein